ncbi:MAG: PAS domain S-box protein [Actinobacteria bacterium]|nr:PAS domain S-box protein [Actinomycetota bacterium]
MKMQDPPAMPAEKPSNGMPKKASAYIGLVTGSGLLAIAISIVLGQAWVWHHLVAFASLVGGIMFAEWFVISLTLKNESMSFSITEIAMTIGLMAVPAPALVLAAGLGVAGGQLLRKRPLVKSVFNVGMYALASAGAATIYSAMRRAGIADAHGWLAAIVGMAVFYSLNQTLLAYVVAFVERQDVMDVLRVGAPILAAVWAGNVTFGIMADFIWNTNPAAIAFLVLPAALSFIAYRAWIHSKNEGRKMRDLYTVGGSLVASLGSGDGLVQFLKATKQMFRATGVEIITFEGPGAMSILTDQGEVRTETFSSLKTPEGDYHVALDKYMISRGWSSHLHATLASEIGVSGALILQGYVGPEGPADFPKQDENLLQTLSNEASIAIRNYALFESISEERSKLSDIVEHTSDGIYQVSTDRRIMTWNPAMESITGFSAAEAVGQMCFNLLRARDSRGIDMCSRNCPIIEAGIHKCHQEAQAQIMTKDGSVRWISYTHSPIFDIAGEMTSDVIVVRDVTKQRAAQEAKDDFVSTVTHELRTPITPIKGFLLTLLRDDITIAAPERIKFYRMMLGQTERLERLIGDLLDASRLESGRLKVEPHIVDTSNLIFHMIENYKASHPEREFRFSAAKEVTLAQADQTRLEQVVGNLMTNAIRYSPITEPIDVMVRQEGIEVVIAVRDRGPGIPYDEQEMIFERFYRSGHHLTREQGGTGLGLYIARRLAEAMGGTLTLSSRLGQGSTFQVRLATPSKADPSRRVEHA